MSPKKEKKLKAPPAYEFTSSYRGPCMVMVDKTNKRTVTLAEWPQSLVDAYRAGVLTGEAEALGEILAAPRKQLLNHPWRTQVTENKRSEAFLV